MFACALVLLSHPSVLVLWKTCVQHGYESNGLWILRKSWISKVGISTLDTFRIRVQDTLCPCSENICDTFYPCLCFSRRSYSVFNLESSTIVPIPYSILPFLQIPIKRVYPKPRFQNLHSMQVVRMVALESRQGGEFPQIDMLFKCGAFLKVQIYRVSKFWGEDFLLLLCHHFHVKLLRQEEPVIEGCSVYGRGSNSGGENLCLKRRVLYPNLGELHSKLLASNEVSGGLTLMCSNEDQMLEDYLPLCQPSLVETPLHELLTLV